MEFMNLFLKLNTLLTVSAVKDILFYIHYNKLTRKKDGRQLVSNHCYCISSLTSKDIIIRTSREYNDSEP